MATPEILKTNFNNCKLDDLFSIALHDSNLKNLTLFSWAEAMYQSVSANQKLLDRMMSAMTYLRVKITEAQKVSKQNLPVSPAASDKTDSSSSTSDIDSTFKTAHA
jgi:hypothetical protein